MATGKNHHERSDLSLDLSVRPLFLPETETTPRHDPLGKLSPRRLDPDDYPPSRPSGSLPDTSTGAVSMSGTPCSASPSPSASDGPPHLLVPLDPGRRCTRPEDTRSAGADILPRDILDSSSYLSCVSSSAVSPVGPHTEWREQMSLRNHPGPGTRGRPTYSTSFVTGVR